MRLQPLRKRTSLLSQRFDQFGRRHNLTHMALGVVGNMDERATDGCGQLLAAYEARHVEVGGGQRADAIGGVLERDLDFGDEFGEGFFAG